MYAEMLIQKKPTCCMKAATRLAQSSSFYNCKRLRPREPRQNNEIHAMVIQTKHILAETIQNGKCKNIKMLIAFICI